MKKSKVKKGNTSWMPASLNEFENKDPNYTYRMMRKDPDNLAKKSKEGWEVVSGVQDSSVEHQDANRIEDGKPLTSVQEGRDWILGRIPNEVAQARHDYHDKENKRREAGLTAHLKDKMKKEGGNAPVHGEITISSRRGTETYE